MFKNNAPNVFRCYEKGKLFLKTNFNLIKCLFTENDYIDDSVRKSLKHLLGNVYTILLVCIKNENLNDKRNLDISTDLFHRFRSKFEYLLLLSLYVDNEEVKDNIYIKWNDKTDGNLKTQNLPTNFVQSWQKAVKNNIIKNNWILIWNTQEYFAVKTNEDEMKEELEELISEIKNEEEESSIENDDFIADEDEDPNDYIKIQSIPNPSSSNENQCDNIMEFESNPFFVDSDASDTDSCEAIPGNADGTCSIDTDLPKTSNKQWRKP